jgi:endonuclease/exonuclease/phosphatase family metal-dependent hydrolase
MSQQQQLHAVLCEVRLEARQIGSDQITKAALRAPVNHQNPLAAEIVERNWIACEIGKAEGRKLCAHLDSLRFGGRGRGVALLKRIQPQEHPPLLFHDLVKPKPDTYEDENQQQFK